MSDAATILIADDEQECIDFVRDALADTPHEILVARDGEEALSIARERKPDLIILDVQMPKRDGFAVFAELRADEALRDTPVIMLTAIVERTGVELSARDMGEYMGSEPDAFVDKPIEPIVLKQAVKTLLKRSKSES